MSERKQGVLEVIIIKQFCLSEKHNSTKIIIIWESRCSDNHYHVEILGNRSKDKNMNMMIV